MEMSTASINELRQLRFRRPRTPGMEESSCWTAHTGDIAGHNQKQTEDIYI